MANQQQTRVIRVTIDNKTRGEIRNIENSLKSMESSVKRTANATNFLANAFKAVTAFSFAGFGIRNLVEVTDSMQLLTDKVGLFTKEGEDSLQIMNMLSEAASRQGQKVDDLATIYTRLGISLEKTGVSATQLVGLTEALATSFRLAGATSAEVVAVSIQLSQAFASGQLRGQELRSVVEQNAVLAQALTEKFKNAGLAGKSLFKFSEERGGITAKETIEAIADQIENWEARTKTLNFTLRQTFNIVTNQLKVSLNEVNKEFNISGNISKALLIVFGDLNRTLAVTIGLLVAAKSAAILGALQAGITSLTVAIGSAVVAAGSISGAISVAAVAASVFVVKFALIAASVTYLTYLFLDFEGTINFTKKGFKSFLIFISEGIETLAKKSLELSGFSSVFKSIGDVLMSSSSGLKEFADNIKVEEDKPSKMEQSLRSLKDTLIETLKTMEASSSGVRGLKELNAEFEKTGNIEKYTESLRNLKKAEILENAKSGKINIFERNKQLEELAKLGQEKIPKATENLAELNREYARGAITASQYFAAIDTAKLADLETKFSKGSIDLGQLKSSEFQTKINELTRELNRGGIAYSEYQSAVDEVRFEELTYKLNAGTISLMEYNEQVVRLNDRVREGSALAAGAQRYVERVGSLSNQIANGIENVFVRLEDSLMEFIKRGTFEFDKFAQAILDDIQRIVIRMSIVQPLASAVVGAFAPSAPVQGGGGAGPSLGTAGGANYLQQAKGGAWSRGIQFFADGGVVNSPTMFGHSRGLGIMGEAGPEAILPLKRGTDGSLGVQSTPPNVIVNVMNQADGAQVEASETTNDKGERVIQLMIVNTVKNALSDGSLDKTLSNSYGLNRRR